MKLSDLSIEILKDYVIGDSDYTPYLTGPNIIKLFNQAGIRDTYNKIKTDAKPQGLPDGLSRKQYAEKILKELNGSSKLKVIFNLIADSRNFAKDKNLNRDIAVEKINEIIINDGYKFQDFDGVYKITGDDLPDDVEVTPHFEGIQAQIIEEIKAARYLIWVCVAWITDKIILNELYRRQKEGLNIRIITIDDKINEETIEKCKKYFETVAVPPRGIFENLMHNKFCVIDLKTVIQGSYNWTNKAQYNNEAITIDNSREIAEQFMNNFIKLWNMKE